MIYGCNIVSVKRKKTYLTVFVKLRKAPNVNLLVINNTPAGFQQSFIVFP